VLARNTTAISTLILILTLEVTSSKNSSEVHTSFLYKILHAGLTNQTVTRMWDNAQRDGRPAEYRWCLCSTP